MKRHRRIYWLLLGLIICIGCEKEPFDYRNKFIGHWEFKVVRTQFNMGSGAYSQDSSIYPVQMKYGSNHDELRLVFPSYHYITIKVNREDEIHNYNGNYFGGEFFGSDSLNLFIRSGGLGGGTSNRYYGKKIKIRDKYF